MMNAAIPCPVCGGESTLLDVLDFNKSCEETKGKFLALAGIPVYYSLCGNCHFCFAPEISSWSKADFMEKIYNQDYILVDPDYLEFRPRSNAQSLISRFPDQGSEIRHLDFGGGNGLLSKMLRDANWNSSSYDPLMDEQLDMTSLGKFDLITAFEVFEHAPDVQKLIAMLSLLLEPNGMVLFTTLTSDGHIARNQRITWWYAAPRNGHISLFSKKSLTILGAGKGYTFGSFSELTHVYFKDIPSWARHFLRKD